MNSKFECKIKRNVRLSPGTIATGSCLFTITIWLVASFFSHDTGILVIWMATLQGALCGFVTWVWSSSSEWQELNYGPGIITAIVLHILSKYWIFNVPPFLFPDAVFLTSNADKSYFIAATLAALFMAVGCFAGIQMVSLLKNKFKRIKNRHISYVIWLPSPPILLISASVLQLMLVYATVNYGYLWGFFSDSHLPTDIPLADQIIVYGILNALPIAPALCAAVLLKTNSNKIRRVALYLSFVFLCITITSLIIWQMRLWAMLSTALYLWCLWRGRFLSAKHMIIIPFVLFVIYSAVTMIRYSQVPILLFERGFAEVTWDEIVQAAYEKKDAQGASDSTATAILIRDISYSWAGLDSTAKILEAQQTDRISPQWGAVMFAGYLDALPAFIRPQGAVLMAVKNFGIEKGILGANDYVAPLILEFAIDFGLLLIFIPAFCFGAVCKLVDLCLLWWGNYHGWSGLKIVRLIWLLQIIFVGSTAGVSLALVKACSGMFFILLLIGYLFDHKSKRRFKSLLQPAHLE